MLPFLFLWTTITSPLVFTHITVGYSSDHQQQCPISSINRLSNSNTAASHEQPIVYNDKDLDLNTTDDFGGWFIPHNYSERFTGPCNINKVNWTLTDQEFIHQYAYREPVILVGLSDQSEFKRYSTRERLLSDYGHDLITVTTANTYSYPKVKMSLNEYVDQVMKPQKPGVLGKDTLYHFGDNDRTAWADLFSHYRLPPYSIPSLEPVLSFGLAGPGTGVPFHVHGPTFAETIYGRKRWFLYPPDVTPEFNPDVSTLDWVTDVYPDLPPESRPLECVLHPGEILFFPNMWWHATLNLDAAVFMSTFLA